MKAKSRVQPVVSAPSVSIFQSIPWPRIFAGLFGAFLGLALIKFGNPVILDRFVDAPPEKLVSLERGFAANPELLSPSSNPDASAVLYEPWPVSRGLWILGGLLLVGLKMGRWQPPMGRWIFASAAVWLGWQLLASSQTANPYLTRVTILHFLACAVCLFLGWHSLSRVQRLWPFWTALIIGLWLVFWQGFAQHYGGLEETRQFIYAQPNWKDFSPEFIKRITSGRIYSTLVYPNALAGAILLLLPSVSIALWRLSRRFGNVARGVLVGTLVYAGLACLIWSGSKAGWLIALGLGLVLILSRPISRQIKWLVLAGILALGLSFFFIRYAGYFARGATSVSARFDYWRAALQTAASHPVLGSGPGTFSVSYRKIKKPESEMARLAHNDYLEQASDSGIVGFLAYSLFIVGSLIFTYRRGLVQKDGLRFAVWLGVLGWATQSLVEFGLYIPALAWPAFTFIGWLLAGDRTQPPEAACANQPGRRRRQGYMNAE